MEARNKLWAQLGWTWRPKSEREGGDAVVRNLLLHWFPAKVTEESLSFRYSFWLGTISAVLFFILVVTGGLLMFLYVPSVERAYPSVKDIEYTISYGWFLRGLHRIAAHLMVAAVFLHMVRAFVCGAYKNASPKLQNRPLNWLIGIALLLLTLLLSFTGYLLPWDQLAFWAITVGTNIARAAPLLGEGLRFICLGAHEIEQSTLLRFYVLHCFALPAIVLLLFSWHMWRIRKDGHLACVDHLMQGRKRTDVPPAKAKTYSLLGIAKGRSAQIEASRIDEEEHAVLSSPHLTVRFLLVWVGTVAVSSLLTLVVRAPLEEAANASITPNPAKAPWYFLWLQELVTDTTFRVHGYTVNGAAVGGIFLPSILLGLLALWPYLDRSSANAVGVCFSKERRKQDIVFLAIVMAIMVFTVIGTFLRGPYWNFYWPWEAWPVMPKRF